MGKGIAVILSALILSGAFLYTQSIQPVGRYQGIRFADGGLMVIDTKSGDLWKTYFTEKDFGMTPVQYSFNDTKDYTPETLWARVAAEKENQNR